MNRSSPPTPFDPSAGIGDEAVASVARRIAEFWLTQPGTRDTAKGVREWWLDVPVAEHLVTKALQELTNLGVAGKMEVGDGQTEIYSLTISVAELRQWLSRGARATEVNGSAPTS